MWGENDKDWINELKNEGSLTQEYLASVIDTYYGLWAHYGQGMWGIYKAAHTRELIETGDPMGWKVVNQFFNPKLTWMVYLSPTLTGTFSMVNYQLIYP